MTAQAATITPITEDIITEAPTNWSELCSCVLYVKALGHDISGNAVNLKVNTTTPQVGGLALFRYPDGQGHVAFIEQVLEDGITVSETNYNRCQWSRRFVEFNNYALRGYLAPPALPLQD